jgi:hypothetical protein
MPQKDMQRLRSKFQKKKEIDVPLSQELIVNLLAIMSEGILQLHSYSIPIRASLLLRSDQVQGQKRVLLN